MVQLLRLDGQRIVEAHRGSLQIDTRDDFKKSLSNIDEIKIDAMLALTAEVSQQNDCSDDRDRLYGVCYILKSLLSDITPVNYYKSADEVYTGFVLATLRSIGRFWPTLLKRLTSDMVSEAPSWTPHFEYRYRGIDVSSFDSRYLRIEKSATNHSHMDMDSVEISTSTKLVAKGVLIASIFRTTTTYTCVKSVMDLISVGQVHFRDWLKTFAIFQDKFALKETCQIY